MQLAGTLRQIRKVSRVWRTLTKSAKALLRSCTLEECRQTLIDEGKLDEARGMSDVDDEVLRIVLGEEEAQPGPSSDRGKGPMAEAEDDDDDVSHFILFRYHLIYSMIFVG